MCETRREHRDRDSVKGLEPQKGIRNDISRFLIFIFTFIFALGTYTSPVLANPQGGHVAAGNITIQQTPNSTVIDQTSHKGIINWQNFNIGQNEKTHFQQPAGGITLNRINPTQGASQIFGQLTATGQIILINAAGIYFGPTAYVNVGSIIASTANITDQNFLNGSYHFSQVSPYSGAIVNEGRIIAAEHGLIVLIGSSVSNTGLIQADLGQIVLASGSAFTINFANNDLINFSVDEKVLTPGVDKDGKTLRNGVSNTGQLIANGGKILVSAKAVRDVLDNAINLEGIVEAKSINMQNGEIVLEGNDGTVVVSGKLIATGENVGEQGGTVRITGNQVALTDNATVDVSGDIGGGEVLIGGDYQGKNPDVQNAQRTFIGPNTTIYADALGNGNGGKIIVWANGDTRYYGSIFARGGLQGGDGGFVEISGKDALAFEGKVDTSAVLGNIGRLLLDPKNIEIVANGTAGSVAYSSGNNNLFANAPSATTLITTTSLTAANATIDLQANNDLTITAAINLTAAGANLLARAGRNILVNNNITTNNGNVELYGNSTGALVANRDAGTGSITMATGTTISVGTGKIQLQLENLAGGNAGNITVQNLTASGVNDIQIYSRNAITLNGVITQTSTGRVSIKANQDAAGSEGITMASGSSISTLNASTLAVEANVNDTGGGTGGIQLSNITTGAGGTIQIETDTGSNTTGGSITQLAGTTLNAGAAGRLNLHTPSANTSGIGTSGANILTTTAGGTLDLRVGLGGAFVTNTGNLTLLTSTRNANAPLSVISTGTLTLPVSVINTGTGALTLRSNGGPLTTQEQLLTNGAPLTLFASGLLTINHNLTSANGLMTLTGTGITQATNITVNAGSGNIAANAGTGTLTTNAGSLMLTSGQITVTADNVALNATSQLGGTASGVGSAQTAIVQPSTAGRTIGVAGGVGNLQLSTAGLTRIRATNVLIGNSTAGTITIGTAATTWTPAATFATSLLTFDSASTITQTATAPINLGARGLILRDSNNVSLTDASNVFTNIAATLTGPIQLRSSSALIIAGLTDALGLVNGITTSGNVTLTSSSTISESGSALINGALLATISAGGTTLNNANTISSFNATNTGSGNIALTNTGALSITGITQTVGNLSITNTGAISQTAALTVGGTSSFNAGANAINLSTNGGSNSFTGAVTLLNSGANDAIINNNIALTLAASTVGRKLTATSNAGITLSGSLTANNAGSDSIILKGTTFNNAGAFSLNTGSGRFLVWSGNPANDNRGGLAYNFKQYNATYGVTAVLGSGNGFLYTIAPMITPSLVGSVTKSYDGTTAATLASGNFSSSGAIDGDTVTLNSSSGSYDTKDVGTNKNVTATGISANATNGSATVYGYQMTTTTANANIGTITAASLNVIANNATKTYGQTLTFNGTEFTSSGLQNSETIGSVTLTSSGAVNTAGVAGSPYSIVASAATGGTFNPANYSISYTNGALTVNPASLNVAANNANKTYGQTTTFNGSEFTPTGLQNSETIGSVTLTSSGAVNTASVAGSPYSIVASNATGGTFNPANYSISYTNGALTVNPASLNVAANNASKSYGQTTTFNGTEFTPTGLQNSETIGSVTLTSSGTVNTASVAGSPYSIVASNATGGTFNAANYSISYTDGALTINPASLNVAANDANKTYGQTTTFNGSEFTPTGLQNNETIGSVTLTSSGAASTANVAGSPYSIVASNATGGTFNAANYSISYTDGALTINPASLNVAANDATKTYGQTTTFNGSEFTPTGLQNSETIGSVTLTSSGAVNTAGVAGSPYSIVASNATGGTFNAANYSISYTDGALTINPASLNVAANDATKTYGQTKTFNGSEFTPAGLQNSETIGSVTLTSSGATSTANVAGSPYSIVASNATGGTFNAANYSISYTDGALTINPASLNVAANNATKTYGQTTTFNGSEFTSTGLQNNETIGSVTLTSSGAVNTAGVTGSPYSIVASNAMGGTFNAANYSISYTDGALTINPASLNVAANNANKTYGQTTTFNGSEFTSTGLQNNETIGSVTLTSNGAVNTASVVGSPYSIVASNATGGTFNAANYSISYTDGALTINPASLNVAANDATKTYGQTTTFNGSEFTPTGLQNNETIGSVTLTSSGATSTANVAGSPYSIVASNATGGTFNAANYSISYTDGALTINPASLNVAANDATKTYGQTTTFNGSEFTPTGLQNNETIGSVTLTSSGATSTANVAGSPYSIVASNATGGTFNAANYSISYTDGALTINPASLNVAANDATKTYGQTTTFNGSEFTSTGLQNNETIGSVMLTSSGATSTANVAGSPYSIVASNATGGTFNAANYSISYTDGALTINPASLNVAANDATKTYGQTTTFNGSEFTSTGLQNSETIGSITLTSSGAVNTAGVAGSPYSIVASNATGGTFNAANYSISYTDGALTINPASLNVAANDATKTYGQTTTFNGSEFTSTGLQNSETIGSVTLTSSGATSTANVAGSPYSIVASNATGGTFNAANYSISYTDGVLTINPASLNVAANDATKTYGQTTTFNGTEFTSTGLQNNETIGSVTLTSNGAPSTASVEGSPYSIVASAATGGTFNPANYSINYEDGVLTVTPSGVIPVPPMPPVPVITPLDTGLAVTANTPFTQSVSSEGGNRINDLSITIIGKNTMGSYGATANNIDNQTKANDLTNTATGGQSFFQVVSQYNQAAPSSPVADTAPVADTGFVAGSTAKHFEMVTSTVENLSGIKLVRYSPILGSLLFGAISSIAFLLFLFVLYKRRQVAQQTQALANILTKANYSNFAQRKHYPERVVPVVSSLDVVELLKESLPDGYQIRPTNIPRGVDVSCILIGPLLTKAFFKATGVTPFFAQKSPLLIDV